MSESEEWKKRIEHQERIASEAMEILGKHTALDWEKIWNTALSGTKRPRVGDPYNNQIPDGRKYSAADVKRSDAYYHWRDKNCVAAQIAKENEVFDAKCKALADLKIKKEYPWGK